MSHTIRYAGLVAALGITSVSAAAPVDLSLEPWLAVNDGVMGGISLGRMEESEDGLSFQGDLSLENNGGFASVRRLVEDDLSAATVVRLKVKGDGRRYQFRMRADRQFDNVAWRGQFDTTGDWQTIEMPLEAFQPVWRGRLVPQAGELDPARIQQIGFLLADGREGPFRLDIAGIEFIDGS